MYVLSLMVKLYLAGQGSFGRVIGVKYNDGSPDLGVKVPNGVITDFTYLVDGRKPVNGEVSKRRKKQNQLLHMKEREIYAMGLDHPVFLKQYLDLAKNDMHLPLELFEGINFVDFVNANLTKALNGDERQLHTLVANVMTVVRQVADGLDYLQKEKGIVAICDVKPGNMGLRGKHYIENGTKDYVRPGDVKIFDLASAVTFDEMIGNKECSAGFCITPKYVAPELEVDEYYEVLPVETNTDVFSLGLTLLEALSFVDLRSFSVRDVLRDGKMAYGDFKVYRHLRNLIRNMTLESPSDRIGLEATIEGLDRAMAIHMQDMR